jgi:hypothetical protein
VQGLSRRRGGRDQRRDWLRRAIIPQRLDSHRSTVASRVPDAHDEILVERVQDALRSAKRPPAFPEALDLSVVVAELGRWLADERQWHHADVNSWKSLIGDLRRAVLAYPDGVLVHAGNPADIRAELDTCAREAADKTIRRELLLRNRLRELAESMQDGLARAAARDAAWQDLLARCSSPDEARRAARRLIVLVEWAGHDVSEIRNHLQGILAGGHVGPLAPSWHRLRRARERVAEDPPIATVAVWLRMLFAPVGDPPAIDVGRHVRVFRADWLRSIVEAEDHPDSPSDLALDDGILRDFCLRRVGTDRDADDDDDRTAIPTALVRVELTEVSRADFVALARRTAATLGALGTLYGAAASLWQLDTSYVSFRDGRRSAAESVAPPVESPTIAERVGVDRDPTAAILRHEGERLGRHLPVRDGRMWEISELLVWLRDARSSPPPARLVLCHRAIETVSGWAGVPTPRRFVDDHLIPSWAHGRMLNAIAAIAVDFVYNDNRRLFYEHLAEHQEWAELVNDPALGLREAAETRRPAALMQVLRGLDTLNERIAEDHPTRPRLVALRRDAATGKATLQWFERLVKQGGVNESRRSRTRNALMHGGPLSDGIIDAVLPFAQYMADESLSRALEAHLDAESASGAFLRRSRALERMRRRLADGTPADEALDLGLA